MRGLAISFLFTVTTAATAATNITLSPERIDVLRDFPVSASNPTISVTRLPDHLSMRDIRVQTSPHVRIETLYLEPAPRTPQENARQATLTKQIEHLNARLRVIDREEKTIAERWRYLEALRWDAKSSITPGDLYAFIKEEFANLTQAQTNLAENRRGHIEKRDVLIAERANLGHSTQGTQTLVVTTTGEGLVLVEYPVRNAQYTVQYEGHLDTEHSTLEFRPRLTISQASGMDWENAVFTLRSGAESRRLTSPLPHPQALGKPRPMAMKSRMENMTMDAERGGLYTPSAQAAPQETTVSREGTSVVIKVKGKHTIPGDSRTVTIGLPAITTEADITRRISTADPSGAYVVAAYQLKPGGFLLDSPVRWYRDGLMLGESRLRPVWESAVAEQSFGVDPGIEVEIPPARPFHDRSKIFNKQTVTVDRKARITNRYTHPVVIHLIDAYPYSTDDDISVVGLHTIPTPRSHLKSRIGDALDDHHNIWERTVNGGNVLELEWGYRVEAPGSIHLPF